MRDIYQDFAFNSVATNISVRYDPIILMELALGNFLYNDSRGLGSGGRNNPKVSLRTYLVYVLEGFVVCIILFFYELNG